MGRLVHALAGLALLSALVLLVVLLRARRRADPALLRPLALAAALFDGIGLCLPLAAISGTGEMVLDTAILGCKAGWALAILVLGQRILLPGERGIRWRLPIVAAAILSALVLAGWVEFLREGRTGILHEVNSSTDYALFCGVIVGAFWMRSRSAAFPDRAFRLGIQVLTGLNIGLFALLCLWWILGGGVRASHPLVHRAFLSGIFVYFNASLALWVVRHGRVLSPREVILDAPATISDALADHYGVSKREREVVAWIVRGKSNREIASGLFISVHTVKEHVANLFRKTGAKNRVQLARLFMGQHDSGPVSRPE